MLIRTEFTGGVFFRPILRAAGSSKFEGYMSSSRAKAATFKGTDSHTAKRPEVLGAGMAPLPSGASTGRFYCTIKIKFGICCWDCGVKRASGQSNCYAVWSARCWKTYYEANRYTDGQRSGYFPKPIARAAFHVVHHADRSGADH